MYRVLSDGAFSVSFYGWSSADKFLAAYRAAGFRVVGHIAFIKRYASRTRFLRYQHECAHLLVKGNPWQRAEIIGDVLEWTYTGNRLHPTQKPLSVLMPLINAFSNPGELVLDPFAGSGSTLAAAKVLVRGWLGIELDLQYHATASKRMSEPVHVGLTDFSGTSCADLVKAIRPEPWMGRAQTRDDVSPLELVAVNGGQHV
jgi:site-specific DNA-methyltransferase (adenine-specific)